MRIALTHACTFPYSEWGLSRETRDRVSPQLAHRLHHTDEPMDMLLNMLALEFILQAPS